MLENVFAELDLKPVEHQVFFKLMEGGSSTAGALAQKMDIPRATLYGYLENLQSAGLISSVIESGVKVFAPEPPEKISLLYQQKIERMQVQQQKLTDQLTDLSQRMTQSRHKPAVRYFEGRQGIQNMLQDMLLHHNITVHSFWPIKAMVGVLSFDFLWGFNIQRIHQDIRLKAIWPPNQAVDVKKTQFMASAPEHLREARLAPASIDSEVSYMVYCDKVMVMSSLEENYGFIIESPAMARMMLTQFNLIWGVSEPLQHNVKDTADFLEDLQVTNTTS